MFFGETPFPEKLKLKIMHGEQPREKCRLICAASSIYRNKDHVKFLGEVRV